MAEGGKTDEAKGRVKEAAGSLLGDEEMKRKGRADQVAGKAKRKAEELIDEARKLVGSDDDDDEKESKGKGK